MEFIEYIENLNWQTIVAIFVVGWYFTKDIRDALIKLEIDVKEQGKRTDRLYEIYLENQKEFNDKFYDLLKETKKQ